MRQVPRPIPMPIADDRPPGLMQCRSCRQWYNVFEGPHAPKCIASLGTMDKLPSWLPPLPPEPVRRNPGRRVA